MPLKTKYRLCLTFPDKPCNKVLRISEHSHLQVFLYHSFLYVFKVVSGVDSRTATKYLRLSFNTNRMFRLRPESAFES